MLLQINGIICAVFQKDFKVIPNRFILLDANEIMQWKRASTEGGAVITPPADATRPSRHPPLNLTAGAICSAKRDLPAKACVSGHSFMGSSMEKHKHIHRHVHRGTIHNSACRRGPAKEPLYHESR